MEKNSFANQSKAVFSVPFRFKGVHSCKAVVLACIDFRFWRETDQFVREYLGIEDFDFPKLPGAAKAINEPETGEIPFLCLDVPCRLHEAKKIILVNHSDCGAYGGLKKFDGDLKKEEDFHRQELEKAKKRLQKDFPEKEIILVFAGLDKDQKTVNFKIF